MPKCVHSGKVIGLPLDATFAEASSIIALPVGGATLFVKVGICFANCSA